MTRFGAFAKKLIVSAAALSCACAFAVTVDIEKLAPVDDTPVVNLRMQPSSAEVGQPVAVWVVLSIKNIFDHSAPYTRHFLMSSNNSSVSIIGADADLAQGVGSLPATLSAPAFPSAGLNRQIMGPTIGEFAIDLSGLNMIGARYSVFTKTKDSGAKVFGPAVVDSFTGGLSMADYMGNPVLPLVPALGGAGYVQPDAEGNGAALTGFRLSSSSITTGTNERIQIIPMPVGADVNSCYSFSSFLDVSRGVVSLGNVDMSFVSAEGYRDTVYCGNFSAEVLIKKGSGVPAGTLTGIALSASDITVGTTEKLQLIPTPVGADLSSCYSFSGFLDVDRGIISIGYYIDESLVSAGGYRDRIVCGTQTVEVLIKPRAGTSGGGVPGGGPVADLVTNVALNRATGADGVTTLSMVVTAQSGVNGLLAIGALNTRTGHWLLHNGAQWVDFYPGYSAPAIYNPSLSFASQPTYTATVRYQNGPAMSGVTIVAIIVRPDGRVDDLGVLEVFP